MINQREFRIGNKIIKLGFDQFQPIPITPEILEKYGFIIKTDTTRLSKTYELDGYVLQEMRRGYWLIKDRALICKHKIFNLHELQNIYFCLVDKELEVKL